MLPVWYLLPFSSHPHSMSLFPLLFFLLETDSSLLLNVGLEWCHFSSQETLDRSIYIYIYMINTYLITFFFCLLELFPLNASWTGSGHCYINCFTCICQINLHFSSSGQGVFCWCIHKSFYQCFVQPRKLAVRLQLRLFGLGLYFVATIQAQFNQETLFESESIHHLDLDTQPKFNLILFFQVWRFVLIRLDSGYLDG